MKNRLMRTIFAAWGLCLLLAACQGTEQPPASSAPAVVPSSSEASLPQTPTPDVTSAPSSWPDSTSSLPSNFDEVWAENPIEAALQEELDSANNFDDITWAYIHATERWARLIPIAFEDCLSLLSPEDQEALQTDQEKWKADLDEKLQYLEDNLDKMVEGNEAAAREACELYEERAYSLCKRKFCADGVMPSFEEAMEEPEAAG